MNHKKYFLTLFIFTTLFVFVFSMVEPATVHACVPVRIMPLGDSITEGDTGSGSAATPSEIAYRKDLYNKLVGAGYSFDFVGSQFDGSSQFPDAQHEGHSAQSALWMVPRVYGFLDANPADVVLLHIGTVNIDPANHNVIAAILNEIDRWEQDNNQRVIVLWARIINQNPPEASVSQFNNGNQPSVQGRADVYVVDMENGAGLVYDFTHFVDKFHPNPAGFALMADLWFRSLTGVLPAPGSCFNPVPKDPSRPVGAPPPVADAPPNTNGDAPNTQDNTPDQPQANVPVDGPRVESTIALNVRAEPFIEEDNIVGQILPGTFYAITEAGNEWYGILYNGTTYYVAADYVQVFGSLGGVPPIEAEEGEVIVASDDEQDDAPEVTAEPEGTEEPLQQLMEISFVDSSAIFTPETEGDSTDTSRMMESAQALSLWSEPSNQGQYLGTLNADESYTVTDFSEGWFEITYMEETVYAFAQYVLVRTPENSLIETYIPPDSVIIDLDEQGERAGNRGEVSTETGSFLAVMGDDAQSDGANSNAFQQQGDNDDTADEIETPEPPPPAVTEEPAPEATAEISQPPTDDTVEAEETPEVSQPPAEDVVEAEETPEPPPPVVSNGSSAIAEVGSRIESTIALNVRQTPSLDAPVRGQILPGDIYEIAEIVENGDWFGILFEAEMGYVAAEYIFVYED